MLTGSSITPDAPRAPRPAHSRAFTLIELLIIVTILGILAAILIPQFSRASSEAVKSALRSDLHTIREQFELYRGNNLGMLPPADGAAPFGAGGGWGIMVSSLYLRDEPFNGYTGGAVLGVTASMGATIAQPQGYGVGWEYMLITPTNLDIWASGYDEASNRLSEE